MSFHLSPGLDFKSSKRRFSHARALSNKTTPMKISRQNTQEERDIFSDVDESKRDSTSCPELSNIDNSMYSDSPSE